MASKSVGSVIIDINSETSGIEHGVNKTNEGLKSIDTHAQSAQKTLSKFALAAAGIYAVGKAFSFVSDQVVSFTNTAAQFEQFETTLRSITGSSDAAKQSMSWIQNFAKTTPYEINKVTKAFVQMKAYGLDPMDGTLTALGNASSAMGKDIVQAVEAMADAVTGENERLKEFGIKASKAGDTIAYSWADSSGKAREIVIKNNKDIIQSTLNAIFNEKYIGAMDAQSKTWAGMISNMSDSWTNFQKDIMDQGLFNYMKAMLKVGGDMMSEIFSDAAGGAKEWSKSIIAGIESTIRGIGILKDAWSGYSTVFGFIKTAFWQMVGVFGTGMNAIQKGWNTLSNSMSTMWASMANGVKHVFEVMINWIIDKINSISDSINKAAGLAGIDQVFGKLQSVSFEKTKAETVALGEEISNVATAWQYAKDAAREYAKDWEDFTSGAGQASAEAMIRKIKAVEESLLKTSSANTKEKENAKKILDDMIKNSLKLAKNEEKAAKSSKAANKEREKAAKAAKKTDDEAHKLGVQAGEAYSDAFMSVMHGDFSSALTTLFDQLFKEDIMKSASSMFSGLGSSMSGMAAGLAGGLTSVLSMGLGMLMDSLFGSTVAPKPEHDVYQFESRSLENIMTDIKDVQYPMLEYTKSMDRHLSVIEQSFGGMESALINAGFMIDTEYKGGMRNKTVELSGSYLQLAAIQAGQQIEDYWAQITNEFKVTVSRWTGRTNTDYENSYQQIGDEIGQFIINAVNEGVKSIELTGAKLGIDTSAIADMTMTFKEINVTDMDAGEIVADIQRSVSAHLDQATKELFGNILDGYREDIVGFYEKTVAITTDFDQVTHSLSLMGVALEDVTTSVERTISLAPWGEEGKYITGMKEATTYAWEFSEAMIAGAGGMDKLTSGMNDYMDMFFTEQEKYDMQLKTLETSFATLGISMPKTNKEFRQLVESLNLSTIEGATAYGELMNIAGAFNELTSAGEELANSVETVSKVIDAWLGNLSYLTLQQKTDLATGYFGMQRSAQSAQAMAEAAMRTTSTKEEYIPIFNKYIAELEAEDTATLDDVVQRLDILVNEVRELEETQRRIA